MSSARCSGVAQAQPGGSGFLNTWIVSVKKVSSMRSMAMPRVCRVWRCALAASATLRMPVFTTWSSSGISHRPPRRRWARGICCKSKCGPCHRSKRSICRAIVRGRLSWGRVSGSPSARPRQGSRQGQSRQAGVPLRQRVAPSSIIA